VAGSNTARRLCSVPQASPPRCWCRVVPANGPALIPARRGGRQAQKNRTKPVGFGLVFALDQRKTSGLM